MKKYQYILAGAAIGTAVLMAACKPTEADTVSIGNPPSAKLAMNFVQGDSNRVVVTDNSQGAFTRLWDFGNGINSKEATDTAYFPNAGTYTIKLFVSGKGGMSVDSQRVVIAKSDQNLCNDSTIIKLTGGCNATAGKGWTFTVAANAIKVGPTPGSSEWYTSPANGLQVDQYDDTFRFFYKDNHFLYENNGKTVFPDQGYQALPYTPPTDATWQLSRGTGLNGRDQIILPTGSFMGVKDAGIVYDIVELTPTKLVVTVPFLAGGGYFELTFVKR